MAKLYFRVASDWQEVVRLRQEIDKLKATLKTMDSTQSPAAFKTMNSQLSEATKKMDDLVTEAAKAGAKIEGGFKKKIFDASQVVNGLTEKITLQRGVIQQLRNELSGLKDKYKDALKSDGDVNGLGAKIKSVNARLGEQKAVLFGLTQQQAGARLNVKKLRDEYELYNNEGKEVNGTNESLALSWEKVLGVLGGATALKAFVSEMVNVRGQFQQLEIAFGTMLKSKEKADKLMSELVNIAAKTPFDLQGIASSAKQMIAYGSSAESVGKELVMLGNVAAGVGAQLGDIAYLYGTLRTQGRAYATDIRQFAGRGIPIYEELAKVMGVTKDKISDLVSQGKVGFKEVEQAFQNMTKEGGMYFNLMEEQSKSLTGQISNLGDAWDSMLNEMGKKGEGVFYTAISAAKGLVENYEKVGKLIAGLIATYGAYRTAIMLSTVATSKHTLAEVTLTNARVIARKAQMALNAAMLTNPYVALAVAVAGLVGVIWALSDSSTAAERTQRKLREEQDKLTEKEEKRRSQIDSLIRVIKDETETELAKITAYEQLQKLSPAITSAYKLEELAVLDLVEANKLLNKERDTNVYDSYIKNIEESSRRLEKLKKDNGRVMGISPSTGIAIRVDNSQKIKEEEDYIKGQKKALKEFSEKLMSLEKEEEESTYKQDFDRAKKEWDEAKKKLSEIEKDKEKYTSKQYKDAKKDAEAKEKAYKDLGGLTGGELTKAEKQAEKDKKKEQKSAEDILSIKRKAQQEEINLMKEGAEKKRRQVEHDYLVEIDAYNKAKKEHGSTKEVEGIKTMADAKRIYGLAKITEDEIEASMESNERYLKEYGTFMQKREAITSEYTRKISKATTQDDKNYLQKKMEEELEKLDVDSLRKGIDWENVFGNLDKVSSDTLKNLKTELKGFISEEKKLSPENMKELVEAIEKIDNEIMDRNPFEAMSKSFKSLKDATDEERKAQEAYNKALKEGTMEEKENTASTLEKAKDLKRKALYDATEALHKGVEEIGYYVDGGKEVIGIMEKLGINTPKWLEGAIAGFGEVLNGLGSIDLEKPMSIVTGGLRAVKGALSSVISLGGAINWNGSNAKEVNESIDRLTSRNESLQTSIESLTDEMKASRGTKSVIAYKSAYEYQKEQNANYLKMAQEQARYHNSHKSWQYYMNWSDEDLKWIQQNVSGGFTGTSSLWSLTPEEMEKLRSNVDIWNKMQDAGKGGYGDRVTDRLDAYIEQAGKLEELTESLNESLTAISFDGMYDSFVNNLMDMKYDAKAAAEDISEYFMRAMLSNKIGEMYSDKLKKWWEKFAKSNEDNNMTEEERKALQDEYLSYVEEAIKLRDELAATTGYDKIAQETNQQSSSRGFGSEMTHEDAGELSGRFTALQITGEQILTMNKEIRNIADESRDLIANSYLELVQISENTGAIVKPIQQIQKDMEEVKRNTSRL